MVKPTKQPGNFCGETYQQTFLEAYIRGEIYQQTGNLCRPIMVNVKLAHQTMEFEATCIAVVNVIKRWKLWPT